MVAPLGFLPLLFALGLVGLLALARVDEGIDRTLSRIALLAFERYVDGDRPERRRLLQSASVAETYRAYAAKTYLYAAVAAVAGSVVGVYALGALILSVPAIGEVVAGLPRTMTVALGNPREWSVEVSRNQAFLLVLGGGLVSGLVAGVATPVLRWQLPRGRAEARRRRINEGLARTVAFLYALSRGRVAFPEVMRTLAYNRRIYGDAADEVSVAVREMDLFGTDVITAVRRTTERTPSEEFRTFGENLASVLQSGQRLPEFLRQQYDRYQEEAEERQQEVLDLLAIVAEVYVTVLVAGILFLITILLVFGLTTTDTLWLLEMIAYVVVPLANVGFVVFLAQQLELLGVARGGASSVPEETPAAPLPEAATAGRRADGGSLADPNFDRLAIHDAFRSVQSVLRRPLQTVADRPVALLSLTVPLALVWVGMRLPTALAGEGVAVRTLDDLLVQAALFVLGSYAVVREYHRRRLNRIDAATPELLDRLASLNEAGMSVVESFERVRGGDLGALSGEVDRVWTDVTLGANVDEALVRFGHRVRTTPVSRAVTLITNALRASGNVGPVLRIAAAQARADLRLRRQRRQQMLTYLVVIYIAFLVFLVIIVAVDEVLIPSLPENVPTPDRSNRLGVDASQFARLAGVDKAAYTLVFFHTALLQALLSGFVGGQLGEGTVRDGAKHAAVMLGVAYVAFLLLSSPVASVEFQDQTATEAVVVDSVSLSEGGFVVLHAHSPAGDVVGHSEYLPAGKSTDVRIGIERRPGEEVTVVAVPHLDTNDDEALDSEGGEVDRIYPPGVERVVTEATVDFETGDARGGAGDVEPAGP